MKPRNAAQVRALLANRADTRPRNEAPAVTIDGTVANVRLFDAIDGWGGYWGLSADELAAALDALPANIATIRLLINSPGGDVYDGIAMVNTLRAHRARVVAVVQGLAASAASFIAVSADETIMAPNSELMIHNPWVGIVGDADEHRKVADSLDRLADNMASLYAAKAGRTVKHWRSAMADETWYTADEAVAARLADRVDEPVSAAARAEADARALAALPVLADRHRLDELALAEL